MLVGNKKDLEEERQVPSETGAKLAGKYKNCTFIETSAKLQVNVQQAFELLIKKIRAQQPKKKKSSGCQIL